MNINFSRYVKILHSIWEAIRILWKISPRLLIAVLGINLVWGALSLPAFYIEKLIIDRIVANIGTKNIQLVLYPILYLVAIRAGIEFLRLVLGNVSDYLRFITSRLFSTETEIMLSEKVSELDVATLEDPAFQDKFNKIQREVGSRAWNFIFPIVNVPNYLAGFISSLGLLVFLSPFAAIAVILVAIPQFIFDAIFIRKEYSLNSRQSHMYRTWGWLVHYLLRSRNYLELKLLNISPYFLKKLKGIVHNIYEPKIQLEKTRTKNFVLTSIPSGILVFLINSYVVFLAITRKITVGSVEMYTRAVLSVQNNVGGLVSSFLQIYESYIYIEDLLWLLNLKTKVEHVNKGIILNKITKSIKFENVWFAYTDKKWILKNINFELKMGEKVAIVGENGSGKSTLIKLIARFYDPQKGHIFIDGLPLKDFNLSEYRKKIAILIQRFETYPFSVKESIAYGDVSRMNEFSEIVFAAKQTDMDTWISKLPLAYDTPLSPEFEKGVEPSIGQWQRIAISRILFRRNAQILILDEPTSNVDPQAEEDIFKKIANSTKDKLLIFVSQRFSTVRWADKILVVKKGKIIEQGTHKELMKEKGEYSKLFLLQAKGYK